MARLATEYTEKAYDENLTGDYLSMMMKDYDFKDPEDFLLSLGTKDFKLPQKSRDIFFYLPHKMIRIFPTVLMFENINLHDGSSKVQPFYYSATRFKETAEMFYFGSGISMDKKSAVVTIGQQKIQAKRFVTVGYDKRGKLNKNIQNINPNSSISVIYMASYGEFLILDERMYNSSFVQLFVLENFDKELFEPVMMTLNAKVYKLKR